LHKKNVYLFRVKKRISTRHRKNFLTIKTNKTLKKICNSNIYCFGF